MRPPFLLGIALIVSCGVFSAQALAVTITSQSETSPYPGIRLVTLRTTSPTTRAWAAYIDLCNEYVHVDATSAPSTLRSTGAWASSLGVQIATNGDFYRTGPLRVYGQAVGSGTLWPKNQTGTDTAYASEWYYERYGWIAFGPDWVDFTHTGYVKKNPQEFDVQQGFRPSEVTHAVPPGTLALVSGFPALVVEGKRVTCSSPTASSCFPDRSDMRVRHPRTAMGLTEDRRTFLLVVVDGRTSVSSGMYGTELAELMDLLGAWQAFNLDGGGSTQMWLDGTGYVNSATGNNGGSIRSVANHWGVFAGAGGGKGRKPGHCVDYMTAAILQSSMQQSRGSTDYDGDGRADACIRGEQGVSCSRGGESSMGDSQLFIGLEDESGWADLTNYGTLRMGDVDGDGKADLCARANARVQCWTTESEPFDTRIDGPELSDAAGWHRPQYYSTIRLADIDGDGRDDLCARGAAGFRCYLSTGDGFSEVIQTDRFSDAEGFGAADKYGTLRMGDIDGDGQADVCARDAEGIRCYLSDGFGFPTEVPGPAWSDSSGWWRPMYFTTIQLVDVNGDGLADLCARTASDFRCHLSEGTSFGPAITKDIMKNESGWNDPSNYATIRLADIDGDGDADLCARANAGIRCWLWEGNGFGDGFDGPLLSDGQGWDLDRKYGSLRLADVTGDRRADLCGLDDEGLFCFPSVVGGFGSRMAGPAWAGLGWMHPSVYGTLLLSGPKPLPEPDAGTPFPEAGTDAGSGWPEAGSEPPDGGLQDAGADVSSPIPWHETTDSDGGCGCGIPQRSGAEGWGLVLFFCLILHHHRRARGKNTPSEP